MIKKKHIALILILSLFSVDINNVYADCSKELKKEYSQTRNQYKTTTKFDSNKKTYIAIIENVISDNFSYASAIISKYECKKISDTVTECYGIKPGTTLYANVIGKTNECNGIIRQDTIKLDNLNKYYGDSLCEGIEEFVLCQETYGREIDRETFEYRVNAYKENKQQKIEEEKKKNEEENNIINKITTYIKENIIQTIIIVVFVILATISTIIMINTSKKSRRLE